MGLDTATPTRLSPMCWQRKNEPRDSGGPLAATPLLDSEVGRPFNGGDLPQGRHQPGDLPLDEAWLATQQLKSIAGSGEKFLPGGLRCNKPIDSKNRRIHGFVTLPGPQIAAFAAY